MLSTVSGFAALVWPPSAIALCAMFLFGRKYWPAVFFAAALVNWTAQAPVPVAGAIAVGNTLAGVFAAEFLRRRTFSPTLEHLGDVFGLILVAVFASLLSSLTGVASLFFGQVIGAEAIGPTWQAWFVGDALGFLIFAPVIFTWATRPMVMLTRTAWLQAAVLIAGVACLSWIIFCDDGRSGLSRFPISFAVYPFVIWAALQFGPVLSASTVLLIAAISVWGTVEGTGPFSGSTLAQNLFFLEGFQAVLAITGMVLAAVVSERKHALNVSEERFRLLVEGVRDYSILMLDPQGRIVSWNDGAREIKGYHSSEIIGQHFSKFCSASDVAAGKPKMQLVVASATGRFEVDGLRIKKDGTSFWANVVITALRDDQGELVGFSKITRDLSDRKRADDEFKQAYGDLEVRLHQAQQAIQSRDEFLSNASHELKTPLTPLLLQLQMVKVAVQKASYALPLGQMDRSLQMLDKCEIQTKRLIALIEELLDLTQISSGKLELKPVEADLSKTAREVIERFGPEAKRSAD